MMIIYYICFISTGKNIKTEKQADTSTNNDEEEKQDMKIQHSNVRQKKRGELNNGVIFTEFTNFLIRKCNKSLSILIIQMKLLCYVVIRVHYGYVATLWMKTINACMRFATVANMYWMNIKDKSLQEEHQDHVLRM